MHIPWKSRYNCKGTVAVASAFGVLSIHDGKKGAEDRVQESLSGQQKLEWQDSTRTQTSTEIG